MSCQTLRAIATPVSGGSDSNSAWDMGPKVQRQSPGPKPGIRSRSRSRSRATLSLHEHPHTPRLHVDLFADDGADLLVLLSPQLDLNHLSLDIVHLDLHYGAG